MKVQISLSVGDYERYVVAMYYRPASIKPVDRTRTRATRVQVRKFVQAALRSSLKEQADALCGKQRRHALRLSDSADHVSDLLIQPRERQLSLL